MLELGRRRELLDADPLHQRGDEVAQPRAGIGGVIVVVGELGVRPRRERPPLRRVEVPQGDWRDPHQAPVAGAPSRCAVERLCSGRGRVAGVGRLQGGAGRRSDIGWFATKPLQVGPECSSRVVAHVGRGRTGKGERHGGVVSALPGLEREPATTDVLADLSTVACPDLRCRHELERTSEGVADGEPEQRPPCSVDDVLLSRRRQLATKAWATR